MGDVCGSVCQRWCGHGGGVKTPSPVQQTRHLQSDFGRFDLSFPDPKPPFLDERHLSRVNRDRFSSSSIRSWIGFDRPRRGMAGEC
ncbi:translation elongation factor G [Anopheles sinensis]|uniref:Translation elongation factor G n=1 Tax=Anopheles sinensis TaxID=74873 RepID=A0A084VSZ0_ANOSI|nr:translation elongation factor G [Anopheles sinensis]